MIWSFSKSFIIIAITIVSELWYLCITSWTRCCCWLPKCISSCLWKNSTSITMSSWWDILSNTIQRISLKIATRSRTLFYCIKSFSSWMNNWHRWISIFWYGKSSFLWDKLNFFMSSRSRRLFICQICLYKINRFRSHSIAIRSIFLFIIFILNKFIITFPGPGSFCNCGIKYELSGSFYRFKPKLFPLFFEYYTKVLI